MCLDSRGSRFLNSFIFRNQLTILGRKVSPSQGGPDLSSGGTQRGGAGVTPSVGRCYHQRFSPYPAVATRRRPGHVTIRESYSSYSLLPRIFKGRRELTGCRWNRCAFQGVGPYLGRNPFQGARPFTKKRELFLGPLPASPGLFALPHSATPGSGI